jgi:CRISPR-associated protein Csb2
VNALECETGWLQGQGWSTPPGSRRVLYRVPPDLLEVSPNRTERTPRLRKYGNQYALIAISTPSRNLSALPTANHAFRLARAFHKALASKIGDRLKQGLDVEELSVRLLGRPSTVSRAIDHQHAFVMPLDLDHDQRLDHLLVWLPSGFCQQTRQLLTRVKKLWAKGFVDLTATFVGCGDEKTVTSAGAIVDPESKVLKSVLGASSLWTSMTPFVAPRFTKKSGKDALESQIRDSLELHRPDLIGKMAAIKVLTPAEALARKQPDCRRFVYNDAGFGGGTHHTPPMSVGYIVELEFAEPVQGPICLGYGSHFGLGLMKQAK